jgi:glycosyltransferase involved in cell wall biosynthesis
MRHTFEIAELLRHRRVHFIKNSYHTFENPARLAPLAREWDEFQRTYPQHTIDFICPTEHELEMFEEAGIRPAHFINKNAFVDENQYRILADVRREYHAIYNGQLKPYKRHELAEAIGNLALIVYRSHTNNLEAAEAYERDIRVRLKHATWLNDLGGFIAPCEISTFLNRARVGLCLSAEEGPMAACMEYFLSGLAVVSTRSLGGREVFFDDQYVRVVDDHPEAVARGVDELIDADISPALIREKTIQKMQVHRDRFIALVNSVIERGGGTPDFHDRFASLFVNKLRAAAPFPGAFLTHISRGMPVELCRQFAAMRNA